MHVLAASSLLTYAVTWWLNNPISPTGHGEACKIERDCFNEMSVCKDSKCTAEFGLYFIGFGYPYVHGTYQ